MTKPPQIRIPLTPKLRNKLCTYQDATATGSTNLLKHAKNIPDGLSPAKISAWLAGATKSALKSDLDYVFDLYEALPQVEIIPLTSSMIQTLKGEINRTNVHTTQLVRSDSNTHNWCTVRRISNWLEGAVNNVNAAHYVHVLELWQKFPSKPEAMVLSEAHRQKLCACLGKADGNISRILRGPQGIRPRDLTGKQVKGWLDGSILKVPQHHFDYVLTKFEEFHRAKRSIVELTKANLQQMRKEKLRTNLEAQDLLKIVGELPEGLTIQMVQDWISKIQTHCRKDHLQFVLHAYKQSSNRPLPIVKPRTERITITPAIFDRLAKCKADSNISVSELMRRAKNVPTGLTRRVVNSWVQGQIKSAETQHLEYVLELWTSLSEIGLGELAQGHVWIDQDIKEHIEAHKLRTGLSIDDILQCDENTLASLTPAVIREWCNGFTRQACKNEVNYLMELWQAQPTITHKMVRVDRQRIQSHIKQHRVNIHDLISNRDDRPNGLCFDTAHAIISGDVLQAREDHIEFILSATSKAGRYPKKIRQSNTDENGRQISSASYDDKPSHN